MKTRRLDKHGWVVFTMATLAALMFCIMVIVTLVDYAESQQAQWQKRDAYRACLARTLYYTPDAITDTDVEAVDAACRDKTGYRQ